MKYFSIGLLSFVLAAALPLAYLVGYGLRRLGDWSTRKGPPGDRVWFFVATAAIFGFLVGSFAQPTWNNFSECRAIGHSKLECLLNRSS